MYKAMLNLSSKMETIDPYQLLGVTTESTPKEVQKAYYNLCLLLHPDRGGNNNDMCVLQKSFETIFANFQKMDLVSNGDLEQLIIAYQKTELYPPFRDIFDACIFDNKEFNKTFEKEDMTVGYTYTASAPGGYSNWFSDKVSNQEENEICTAVTKFMNPVESNLFENTNGEFFELQTHDDYTVVKNPLQLNDCKKAFSGEEPLHVFSVHNKTLEELVEEREKDIKDIDFHHT